MFPRAFMIALLLSAICASQASAQTRPGAIAVPTVRQQVPPPFVHRVPRPEAAAPFRALTPAEANALRRTYRRSLDGSVVDPDIRSPRVSRETGPVPDDGRPRRGIFPADGAAGPGPVRPPLGPRR